MAKSIHKKITAKFALQPGLSRILKIFFEVLSLHQGQFIDIFLFFKIWTSYGSTEKFFEKKVLLNTFSELWIIKY